MLPYSSDILFTLIAEYNQDYRWVALLFLLSSVGVLFHQYRSHSVRWTLALLGMGWIWIGLYYYYTLLNQLFFGAPYYGTVYIIAGSLLLFASRRSEGEQRVTSTPGLNLWWYIIAFVSLAGFPLFDLMTQNGVWPLRLPGMSPEPTLLFTLSIFGLYSRDLPVYVLILPVLTGLAEVYTIIALQHYASALIPICSLLLLIQYFTNMDRRRSNH